MKVDEAKKRTGYKKIDSYEEKAVSAVKFGGYFDWRHFRVVPERLIVLTEKACYEYAQEGKFVFSLPVVQKFGAD